MPQAWCSLFHNGVSVAAPPEGAQLEAPLSVDDCVICTRWSLLQVEPQFTGKP